ncbi:MAG: hypothetical protein U9O53_05160 [archaeon]|nr:hypothetical protein [archaeon]
MAFTVDFLLERLEQQGLFNIILPLLLVFAIVYGILGKINIFGDNDKINAIIAFVFGMYVTVFTEFAAFLINMTAGSMVILVGLLFFLMIVGFGSSLSGGSPTSALAEHKDALTVVLMLIGGILFVNSGGLLVVGAYTVRITLSDIFGLTFLYIIYAVIKSLLGIGKLDPNKVRKLMIRHNDLKRQYDSIQGDDEHAQGARDDIKRQFDHLKIKMKKMGVDPANIHGDEALYDLQNDVIMRGRYGNPYDPYNRRHRLH